MSRFLFISWDGGGNQPPARHIAAELAARGHHTQWLTLPTTPIDLSLVAPPDRATVVFGQIMANPTHVQDVRAHVDADPAGVLVVDCLLFGALAAAQILQVPTGCLVHTLPGAFGGPDPGNPNAPRLLTAINDMRARLGLAQVNDPWQTWTPHTTIVASFPDLDLPAAQRVAGFRWIGPIVDRPTATDVPAIPAQPGPQRVLVSLSTARANIGLEQPKAQRILDALAGLDCQVEVTAPALNADLLRIPDNATVHGYRPHGQLLPDVALTVTHAGHGTVCAALAHGVPLLALPNPVADQPYIADRIAHLGAGIALTHDADPEQIHDAAQTILHDRAYTQAATRLQATIAATPGTPAAADHLETLSRTPAPR